MASLPNPPADKDAAGLYGGVDPFVSSPMGTRVRDTDLCGMPRGGPRPGLVSAQVSQETGHQAGGEDVAVSTPCVPRLPETQLPDPLPRGGLVATARPSPWPKPRLLGAPLASSLRDQAVLPSARPSLPLGVTRIQNWGRSPS